MPNRDLKVTLVGDDKTHGAFHSAAGNAEGFGSKIGGVGKTLGLALGAAVVGGVVGIGAAFVEGAKSAAAYEKITSRTANVIASTGGVANVSAKQIAGLGSEIEGYSNMTNESVESGANLLLTFTNIRNEAGKGNDIFNQSTKVMADMSTALGQDTATSAIQLGKALNDPIKGVSALQRVGVSFTADQKEQIKTLVKSGDTMGAQKVILAELNKEFGGAAKAAGDTFGGKLERLKNQFGDLMRDSVTPLLPKLADLADFLSKRALPAITKIATVAIPAMVNAFKDTIAVIGAVVGWFKQHKTIIEIVAAVIGTVLLPHLIMLAAQATLTGATTVAMWVASQAGAIAASAANVAATYRTIAAWIAQRAAALANFGQTIAIMALYAAESVANAARAGAAWVVAQARTIASLVATAAGFVAQGAVMVASWVATAASVVAGWVLMGVQSLIQAARMAAAWFIALGPVGWVIAAVIGLVALIVANWDTVVQWTTTAWNAVVGALTAAWNWIKGIVSGAVSAVTGAIHAAWSWVTSATSAAWNAMAGAVSAGVSSVISFVQSIPGRILGALGNLGSLLLNAGKNLLEGLWNGISGAASWLLSKVGAFFGNLLPGWVRSMLGIKSPSTVFAEMGKFLMLGMAGGIDSETGSAVSAAQRAAAAISNAMSPRAAIPGMGALSMGSTPGGMVLGGGSAAGSSSGGAVVHIENYNEAQQPVHEVAQELAFLARTR